MQINAEGKYKIRLSEKTAWSKIVAHTPESEGEERRWRGKKSMRDTSI